MIIAAKNTTNFSHNRAREKERKKYTNTTATQWN
jgi:hypothetical protein